MTYLTMILVSHYITGNDTVCQQLLFKFGEVNTDTTQVLVGDNTYASKCSSYSPIAAYSNHLCCPQGRALLMVCAFLGVS